MPEKRGEVTKAEEKLYEMIFTNGKQMLSPEIDNCDFHAMTHEGTEILGMFCDFTNIHGEELKKPPPSPNLGPIFLFLNQICFLLYYNIVTFHQCTSVVSLCSRPPTSGSRQRALFMIKCTLRGKRNVPVANRTS